MSLATRIGIVVVLIAGAALFVSSLAGDPPPKPEPPQIPGDNGEPARDWPEAKAGVLDSAENCKECHAEIYAEWEGDRHSKSWTGKLFTRLSENHKDSSCWPCHAPRPILETGLSSPSETRENYRESGINCLTCHRQGNHVVGPNENPTATPEVGMDCGPKFRSDYPTDRREMQEAVIGFCGVCHNLHGTHEEFRGSKYYREGKTCLSCHMSETVIGPVAKGGKARVRRVHRFPGAHSKAMLKRAIGLDAAVDDGALRVRVTNKGAGHKIPTDARHRAIWVRVAYFDRFGQPVPVAAPDTGTLDREVTIDLIRLFYRPQQKDPTQVPPAGTLGKDNWRESTFPVPSAAKGGKARVRVIYNYYVYDPIEKGVLVQEQEVALDG